MAKAISGKFAKSYLETANEHRVLTIVGRLPCPVLLKRKAKRKQLSMAVRYDCVKIEKIAIFFLSIKWTPWKSAKKVNFLKPATFYTSKIKIDVLWDMSWGVTAAILSCLGFFFINSLIIFTMTSFKKAEKQHVFRPIFEFLLKSWNINFFDCVPNVCAISEPRAEKHFPRIRSSFSCFCYLDFFIIWKNNNHSFWKILRAW